MSPKLLFTLAYMISSISIWTHAFGGEMLLTALPAYLGNASGWWKPEPGLSWQWQLSSNVDITVDADMYDIDLFDTPQNTIDAIHEQGKIVICYLSAGSWEEYRPDASLYPESVLGNSLSGWPDERWIDIRQITVLAPIIQARLDLAKQKNCDGIEPDNIDGYQNNTGFTLQGQDQLNFNTWLASQAHNRGLSIGLKNDLNQVKDLVTYFDWALNEQCFFYDECSLLLPFTQQGKAVFGVEYELSLDQFCPQANAMNFDWLKKRLNLGVWRQACR